MTTELVLLGTAGGPTPRGERHAPSQVVVVDGHAYVIDCGNGVAHQLHRAKVPFSALRSVFITHHHSDHNADVGNLFLLGWPDLHASVPVIGPPPLGAVIRGFLAMNRYDIDLRTADEQRPRLDQFIDPQEIEQDGRVYADDRVEVHAALVEHPPVEPAFAYRLDTADRSIVISGDTRPCEALVELARGADTLVHEVIHVPALDAITRSNNGGAIREHLLRSHTPVDQVGAIAERAGVRRLVLSHLVPSSDAVDDVVWKREAQRGFSGEVIVGQDLMRL